MGGGGHRDSLRKKTVEEEEKLNKSSQAAGETLTLSKTILQAHCLQKIGS